mgnify:FL=1
MKGLFKMLGTLAAAMCLVILSAASVLAAPAGGVDWDQAVIRAEGAGVAPATAYNSVQARLMARRAAIVDAYRQLAEQIKGVNVDATTTVQNMMMTNDTVTTKVSALVQGARIVDEKVLPEGGYSVTLQVPVFGVSNSIASAVLDRPAAYEPFPQPVESVQPSYPIRDNTGTSAASTPAGRAIGGYTGLIVDCRGLELNPVMSPVIKNADGAPIYGYKNLDYDKVVANGMAGYTRDIRNAVRAGSNPLVVQAIGLDNHNSNPILSVADANRVLIENGATGFLNTARVVFVR